ncbi:MAG: hypothetical protein HN348_14735 [Proteobacteria bacterium]|jgi:hypothetical protein|nr:hypothetical protein [Pseudomonadota bacterium]
MSNENHSGWRRWGCLPLSVLLLATPIIIGIAWQHNRAAKRANALEEQAEATEEMFSEALTSLEEGSTKPDYDIDETIRVIHEIDMALKDTGAVEDYLRLVAARDYRHVAPEVLEARQKILDLQMRLQATQIEAKDQAAMWEITSELLLSTLSVVAVSGEASTLGTPSGSMSVDREQAQTILADVKDRRSHHKALLKEIEGMEQELYGALFDYADIFYEYVEEWDQLSLMRDRAYLAAHNQDWPAALMSAELAIEAAPREKEAHLLAAMALIEEDNPEKDQQLENMLSDYMEQHPGSSAPALLLLGVHHANRGHHSEAQLALQQSAAYYPRQADQLTNMLDPYKMRTFLGKSREGQFIVELYLSTMLGAGYFSPDLQMAKTLFDQGNFVDARAKVLDHFARRRTQEQWDFILSDIQFCHDLLGPHFWEIFPEDAYLDLEVTPTMFGSGLNLAVNNRSTQTLHNATLILALHLTDMYPNDYAPLIAERTVPAVLAHDVTSFGAAEVDIDFFGAQKTVDDIVLHRAILVSNEAVVWVDTDEYKTAEAIEFRERKQVAKRTQKAVKHPLASRHPEFTQTVDQLVDGVSEVASLEVESRYGADNVLIELPRELAILRPMFRLRNGEELFAAQDNLIEGDRIVLRFAGVENYDGAEDSGELELLMSSPFGDLVLGFTPGENLTWSFAGIRG